MTRLHAADEQLVAEARAKGATLVTLDACLPGGGPLRMLAALRAAAAESPANAEALGPALRAHDIEAPTVAGLAASAERRYAEFRPLARAVIDRDVSLCVAIREWRLTERASWRWIAAAAYQHALDVLSLPERHLWRPDSNQLMGMALCGTVAGATGEDFLAGPWNEERDDA